MIVDTDPEQIFCFWTNNLFRNVAEHNIYSRTNNLFSLDTDKCLPTWTLVDWSLMVCRCWFWNLKSMVLPFSFGFQLYKMENRWKERVRQNNTRVSVKRVESEIKYGVTSSSSSKTVPASWQLRGPSSTMNNASLEKFHRRCQASGKKQLKCHIV